MITTRETRNQILPFYSKLNQQYRFTGCESCDTVLKFDYKLGLHFDLWFDNAPTGFCFEIVDVCSGVATVWTPDANSIDAIVMNGQVHLMWTGETNELGATVGKSYYFKISGGGQTWYSEMFCIFFAGGQYNDGNYMQLVWSNSTTLGNIYYENGYTNNFFFIANYARPSFETKQEGKEDGYGNFKATFTQRIKRYSFDILVPDWMLDALNFIPMHDSCKLIENAITHEISNIQIDIQGSQNDCFHIVNFSYTLNEDILSACNENKEVKHIKYEFSC